MSAAASAKAPTPVKPTSEQLMAGYAVACRFKVYESQAFELAEQMFQAMTAAGVALPLHVGVALPSQAALDSRSIAMPPSLSPEEKRQFILSHAAGVAVGGPPQQLTADEIEFVVNELHSQGHGHGSSHADFEPECPTCTAADKLAAARNAGVDVWRDPDTGRTTPKPQPCSVEQARAALGMKGGTA